MGEINYERKSRKLPKWLSCQGLQQMKYENEAKQKIMYQICLCRRLTS
jgi:hypothetical protein